MKLSLLWLSFYLGCAAARKRSSLRIWTGEIELRAKESGMLRRAACSSASGLPLPSPDLVGGGVQKPCRACRVTHPLQLQTPNVYFHEKKKTSSFLATTNHIDVRSGRFFFEGTRSLLVPPAKLLRILPCRSLALALALSLAHCKYLTFPLSYLGTNFVRC
jgi:hypothetical protein